MRTPLTMLLCLTLMVGMVMAQYSASQIDQLQEQGKFKEAQDFIKAQLDKQGEKLSKEQRRALEFEIERMERIRQDYDVSREDLIEGLQKRMKDFKPEELDEWESKGMIDARSIDGEKWYVGPTISNLFFRYPELRPRKTTQRPDEFARLIWDNYLQVKEQGDKSLSPLVYPQRYLTEMSIRVKDGIVPEGELVRCWMPFPRHCPLQSEIELIGADPEPKWLGEPQSLIRSVYFEQKAEKDKPVEFKIKYSYKCYSYYSNIDPGKVKEYDENDLNCRGFLQEQPPHVVFLPELHQLCKDIVGEEQNPYQKAWLIYDWLTRNIKYSYAHEYSTMRNISKFVYDHRYGDCGQEGLLFITLCRIAGVPARWQSGWINIPGDEGLHDWQEVYIPPYGWIPVDVYMGVFAYSVIDDWTPEQKEAIRKFYFGNIDHFRLVVNNAYGQPHYPPKEHFRSDTVDFQRGELEWQGGNIYFGKFRYRLDSDALSF